MALDLHIHDLDYAQYLFGVPRQIRSTVANFSNGVPGHVATILDYGDNRAISAVGMLAPWIRHVHIKDALPATA